MVTGALILINVAAYVVLGVAGSNMMQIDVGFVRMFGLSREGLTSGGLWQPITSLFFHFDIAHLGYNMIFLALFGPKGEELYGRGRFLAIYITSGLFASLAFLLYPPESISAGASGAIFGILGANLVALRGKYPGGIKNAILYGFFFFILAKSTGFAAHLGGLVFGFAVGYVITRDWYQGTDEKVELEEGDIEALENEMERMKD
ncbi:rhomboid family intramembrane serine protease [archaeon]|nr:rhomboid family intramembrane serine protease [archaeon]